MRLARALAIAVVLVLVWGVVAQAQQQNKPAQFLQLTITTVRGLAVNDYEEFVKKVNAARDKTPGSPAQIIYAVNLGGPAFTYYTVTQWEKWADRDKFPNFVQMLTKVYSEAETARLQKMQRDAIVQQRTEVFALDAIASLNPKVFDPPAAFINLQRIELQPDSELAQRLRRLNERAADVGILHKACGIRDSGLFGVADRGWRT